MHGAIALHSVAFLERFFEVANILTRDMRFLVPIVVVDVIRAVRVDRGDVASEVQFPAFRAFERSVDPVSNLNSNGVIV